MLTRASIVLLLVLNLGVAAWWVARPSEPQARFDPAIGGAALLRLVEEPTEAAVVTDTEEVPVAEDSEAPSAAAPGAAACHRFGPFADAEAGAAAVAALETAVLQAQLRREWPGPPANWLVILPTPGLEEGAEAARRVAEAGFDDYYVMRQGVDAGVVALGMYGDRNRAGARADALRKAGFEVVVEPFGGGRPEFWVDARAAAGFDAGAAAARIEAPRVVEGSCSGGGRVDAGAAR